LNSNEFFVIQIPSALHRRNIPTLIITGTDDNYYQPHGNSLVLAEKIPGAWLVQIENASHAVMDQYPDEIGKILQTFLSATSPTN
jgi:pimeloyl-ACP methyl ester carboxylesterase